MKVKCGCLWCAAGDGDLITNQNEGEMWVFTSCCVAGDGDLITNQNEGEMWVFTLCCAAGDGEELWEYQRQMACVWIPESHCCLEEVPQRNKQLGGMLCPCGAWMNVHQPLMLSHVSVYCFVDAHWQILLHPQGIICLLGSWRQILTSTGRLYINCSVILG